MGGCERTTAAEEDVRIQILDEAEDDLQNGSEFYGRQKPGVGDYIAAALAADIDSLRVKTPFMSAMQFPHPSVVAVCSRLSRIG